MLFSLFLTTVLKIKKTYPGIQIRQEWRNTKLELPQGHMRSTEKQSRSEAFRKRHRPPTPTPEKKHVISDKTCALGAELTHQVALLTAIRRSSAPHQPSSTPPRVSSFESHTTQASDVTVISDVTMASDVTMVSDVTFDSLYLDSEGGHDVIMTSDECGSDCNDSDYANYMWLKNRSCCVSDNPCRLYSDMWSIQVVDLNSWSFQLYYWLHVVDIHLK